MSASIVIDANLALALVLPLPYSGQVAHWMDSWRESQPRLLVPTLWEYEVVSALRKAVIRAILTQDEAELALAALLDLGHEQIAPHFALDQRALYWAASLNQANVYDAQYLAAAESLGAEFWTADRHLANNARQGDAAWVHWVGEIDHTR